MLAIMGNTAPCAVHSSSAFAAATISGFRHFGTRHTAQRFLHRATPRRFATNSKARFAKVEQGQARVTARTWGDKLVLLGFTLRGAALLPQLISVSRYLRFAGVGPMLVGSVFTVYEIGGWRLLLAIPVTLSGLSCASMISDAHFEERVKVEVLQDLRKDCADIPEEVLSALQAASVKQYETNRMRLDVQILNEYASSGQFRVVVMGSRENMSQPWSISSIEVLRGVKEGSGSQPPPQCRYWDSEPLRWELMWAR